MKKLTTGLIACLLLANSVPALADRGERHFRADRHDRHFDNRPRYYGKQPHHYRHDHHGSALGVLGLGLAVGGVMLALEAPRPPRVVMVPAAPPPPRPSDHTWYYCESAQTYYPYVQFCHEGWRAVPAY
ncbi:MAG: hypothetical protein KKF85_11505 [Gammaproteobacteria bacterium]|nr:hypothetical protein [Rhodocyclaceae bacterium]MBU3907991.1 hypothetical protein [Gammaproteobacteria bacterium]MBU3990627.1 hypothetical protein [Gammaproteobacteria bacterium]MBU4006078.1 hypothetical protein [Gammaproteobacteria bacterium]MBU4022079.1 hypothetical protein [Gammaproteobacteria bacterium]